MHEGYTRKGTTRGRAAAPDRTGCCHVGLLHVVGIQDFLVTTRESRAGTRRFSLEKRHIACIYLVVAVDVI